MCTVIGILVNIRSVHNVGSIFRTADAAGIRKLYLCGTTPTPLDRFEHPRGDFIKVSLGAEQSVVWEHVASAAALVSRLQRDGYYVCALEQSSESISYTAFRPPRGKPIALVVGNEVRGLTPSILRRADVTIEIPMRGIKESLNVSVSFGIASYALAQ